MTREQAAQIMAIQKPSRGTKEKIEAYEMAIKALEQEPCGKDINVPATDAISRQAVDDAIYDYSRSCDVNYQQIMEFIEKIPSVQPQPKTGTWRKDIDNSRRWDRVRFYCSECGSWQTYGETDYCPLCGARMIKPQESEGKTWQD